VRAVTIDRHGGPEVLQHRDIPVPVPAAGEVLVKVAFAGINFMDVHTRQGKYRDSQTYLVRVPCTLGMEGAGVVEGVGSGGSRFVKGDRVAWCISWGAYADYAVVPERLLAKVPDALGLDQAAASIFQGSTAHYLVNDVARLERGSTCLIHAASGIIGQILVQMAKRSGATVFTTGSSEAKCDVARKLGADHAMLYEGFADRIRAATGGRGVDVVFDSVGKVTLRESFRATRARGIVVNYGNVSGSVKDLDPYELGEAGSLFLTRPRLNDHLADAATVQRRADDIFAALLDGTLRIPIVARYKLEDVEKAHARIEGREQVGKAVVGLQ